MFYRKRKENFPSRREPRENVALFYPIPGKESEISIKIGSSHRAPPLLCDVWASRHRMSHIDLFTLFISVTRFWLESQALSPSDVNRVHYNESRYVSEYSA
ncbi:hypothetical protein EVAR_21193_1 [Eumeta japonica]|uniref:Uncharacterized protein n=1 Tax=Eumeta variegata TaxID=151549 RepID=A0A4C1UNN9_EUMVA|nr:hypothetical protein EVAR_21193_1 [Eumeta japonica]